MALATLYNVPSNLQEMNVFSFTNMNEHVKISAALLADFGISSPVFILDPLPLVDPGVWLYQHQTLHNIMNSISGGNSNDLTAVNFNDKGQLSEWIWLHAQEHYTNADFLNLQ